MCTHSSITACVSVRSRANDLINGAWTVAYVRDSTQTDSRMHEYSSHRDDASGFTPHQWHRLVSDGHTSRREPQMSRWVHLLNSHYPYAVSDGVKSHLLHACQARCIRRRATAAAIVTKRPRPRRQQFQARALPRWRLDKTRSRRARRSSRHCEAATLSILFRNCFLRASKAPKLGVTVSWRGPPLQPVGFRASAERCWNGSQHTTM